MFLFISCSSKRLDKNTKAEETIENIFKPGTGANDPVFAISLQPDGKIVVGRNLSMFNGKVKNDLTRLNVDGSLDNSFNSNNPSTEISKQNQ